MENEIIKVHLYNMRGFLNSHIEIVLERSCGNDTCFYTINRWEPPANEWCACRYDYPSSHLIEKHTFSIEANSAEIVREWNDYYKRTESQAFVLTKNCAVAAQWFLTRFAKIPRPDLQNLSFNHVTLGVSWPSVIPCPVLLPGRVMSNAKYHLKKREQQKSSNFLEGLSYLCKFLVSPLIFCISMVQFCLTACIALVSTLCCVALNVGAVALYTPLMGL